MPELIAMPSSNPVVDLAKVLGQLFPSLMGKTTKDSKTGSLSGNVLDSTTLNNIMNSISTSDVTGSNRTSGSSSTAGTNTSESANQQDSKSLVDEITKSISDSRSGSNTSIDELTRSLSETTNSSRTSIDEGTTSVTSKNADPKMLAQLDELISGLAPKLAGAGTSDLVSNIFRQAGDAFAPTLGMQNQAGVHNSTTGALLRNDAIARATGDASAAVLKSQNDAATQIAQLLKTKADATGSFTTVGSRTGSNNTVGSTSGVNTGSRVGSNNTTGFQSGVQTGSRTGSTIGTQRGSTRGSGTTESNTVSDQLVNSLQNTANSQNQTQNQTGTSNKSTTGSTSESGESSVNPTLSSIFGVRNPLDLLLGLGAAGLGAGALNGFFKSTGGAPGLLGSAGDAISKLFGTDAGSVATREAAGTDLTGADDPRLGELGINTDLAAGVELPIVDDYQLGIGDISTLVGAAGGNPMSIAKAVMNIDDLATGVGSLLDDIFDLF